MPPYFQPVIDLIANNPPPNGRLDLVLTLCQEVEAEHGPEIVLATDAVVRDVNSLMSPATFIPEAVWYETMARMLLMGEHADLERLLDWYEVTVRGTRKEMITLHWQGLFEFVVLPQPNLKEKELDRQLVRVIGALKFVMTAFVLAVKDEGPPKKYDASLGELPPGSFGTASYHRPARSAVLAEGIAKLFRVWMALHQQFLDEAWRELGSGAANRGDKLLALRTRWHAALEETFENPSFRTSKGLGQIPIQLGEIAYGTPPNHEYLDAFRPHDSRRFDFTPYDREAQDEPQAKSVWLADMVDYRRRQLYFLLDEYGEFYPSERPSPGGMGSFVAWRLDEARRRARFAARKKLMDLVEKKGASLRLETEDNLVAFGCAYHQVLMSAQPQPSDWLEAWDTLLFFLGLHLRTHTTHTEFNLAEEPSYFDRLFPRAINGGTWMDCGVYAVLFAFIFLSWADCLKSAEYPKAPRVSFVMFPLHVGLIVELDGLLPFVLHNEVLFRLTDEQMKLARKEWDKKSDSSDPKNPDLLELKFLEDLAAQLFLRDVDMPILRQPVGPVSAPPKKKEVWKAFETHVAKQISELFSPRVEKSTAPEFQFDIRFLMLLTQERRWFDRVVVPFWNDDCLKLWQDFAARTINRSKFLDGLKALLAAVDDSYNKEVRQDKDALSLELRSNSKKLLGKAAKRITKAKRLVDFATLIGPVGEVREYHDKASNAQGPLPEPPFASPARRLSRFGD